MPDPDELRIRLASVRIAAASTIALALAGLFYYADTWEQPHRPVMAGLALSFVVMATGLLVGPIAPLITGRLRNPFFVVWSIVSTAAIAALFGLDGGGRSPLAFGFVMALAFAGLLYPLRGAIAVAGLVQGCYLLVALNRPHRLVDVVLVTVTLTCTAMMCVSTAWWRERQRRDLSRLSRTDPLTGCLNRRGFEEALDCAVAGGAPFALITLDLDGLKQVNDEAGHAAGDALLRAAVRTLGEVVRPTDCVGRLGGDEFAVLLPGAPPGVAGRVRDRAVLALAVTAPASFGLANYPRDGSTSDALFQRADAGVYTAKARRGGPRRSRLAQPVLERPLDDGV